MRKKIKLRLPKRFLDGALHKPEHMDDFFKWVRSVEEGNNALLDNVRDPWAFFRQREKE